MTEDEVITGILKREGWDTYTNHPADRGGPTKWGITLASWSAYLGRAATASDVQGITEQQAREFYRDQYIVEPRFNLVRDLPLREILIDAGVNHGVHQASKWIQAAVRVPQDGKLGPMSLSAINATSAHSLFLKVCAQRLRLYGRLTSQDVVLKAARSAGFRCQAEFTSGWCNRLAEFLDSAAHRDGTDHKGVAP